MISENSSILVFDENNDFLKIADHKLSQRGFHVITTTSLMESCEFLEKLNIDYVMVFDKEDKKLISELVSAFNKKIIIVDENFQESIIEKELRAY